MADEAKTSMAKRLNIRGLLIDLNGTLHTGSSTTPRAVEALQRLRASRLPFIFCSNSTKESTKHLLSKLREMGFEVRDRELLTSLGACRAIVEQRKLRPYFLLSPSAQEEFAGLLDTSATGVYDTVILGLHPPSLSYDPLNEAFRVLKGEPISKEGNYIKSSGTSKQVSLIAPHASLFQQSPETDDLPAGLSLGIGPFVRALETASGVQAELVGKPTKPFFQLAIDRMKEIHGEPDGGIGVVGDDVNNDLGDGAKELGLKRILVRTGKYRPGVEDAEQPDAVYDTFADFIDDLLESEST